MKIGGVMIQAVFIVLSFVFMIGIVSAASINVSNYSLVTNYNGGQLIDGWINMSFKNQTNLNFTSSFGTSLDLLNLFNLLELDKDIDYSCIPGDCGPGYNYNNAESSKSFSPNNSSLFGIIFENENDVEIKDIKMHISSDVSKSSLNQLSIDLFDDGTIDFFNNNFVDEAYMDRKYGCFNSSGGTTDLNIGSSRFCEVILLPGASAYRVGARLTNTTNANGSAKIEVYKIDEDMLKVGSCTLNSSTEYPAYLNCLIQYSSNTPFNASVCISGSNYSIRSETRDPCGMVDNSLDYVRDYEVFAYPLKYGPVDAILNKTLYSKLTGQNLLDDLSEYLSNRYGSEDRVNSCKPYCAIPLRVKGISQNAKIDNISISYVSAGTGQSTITSTNLYDLSKATPKISSGFLKVPLSVFNWTVPNINGSRTFEVQLGSNLIISGKIYTSTSFVFDLNPKSALVRRSITFNVNMSNITTNWDFGDGTTISSNNNKGIHKYASSGEYNIKVTAIQSDGKSSTRTFKINIGNPRSSANITLAEYFQRISDVYSQIKTYPDWVQRGILEEINISGMNSSLNSIKESLNSASSDGDLNLILDRLDLLNVPIQIYNSQTGNDLAVATTSDDIDPALLKEITNESYGDDSALKEAISGWMNKYYDLKMDFRVIAENGDESNSTILTKIKIKVNNLGYNKDSYLIIDFPFNSVGFAQDYGQRSINEGASFYIPLTGSKEIELLIPEEINVNQLSAFISPKISELTLPSEISPPVTPKFNWMKFLIGSGIVLMMFFIIYIILKEWYKKNYESNLFKKRDDLINLINFIYNSRLSGMKDNDIQKKLGGAGWNGEQISYAFKKIDGKRTGMWEIPLFSHKERKEVRNEIERKHPEGVDTRFINRSNF